MNSPQQKIKEALKLAAKNARQEAYAAGGPIVFEKEGRLTYRYANGSEFFLRLPMLESKKIVQSFLKSWAFKNKFAFIKRGVGRQTTYFYYSDSSHRAILDTGDEFW